MIAADLLIHERRNIGRPLTLISKSVVGELLAIVYDVEPVQVDGFMYHTRRWAVGPADDRSEITPTGGVVSRRKVPITETTRAAGLRHANRPVGTTTTEQEEA
jgi:hypothetical protein